MSLDWWCSLSQLYFRISLLWDSVPHTSYSISSIFLFLYLIFSLNTSLPVPHSIHRCICHIHLLFSWHILTCFCFSLRVSGSIFTNGLLPYVSYSFTSVTRVRYSQVESNIGLMTKGFFFKYTSIYQKRDLCLVPSFVFL